MEDDFSIESGDPEHTHVWEGEEEVQINQNEENQTKENSDSGKYQSGIVLDLQRQVPESLHTKQELEKHFLLINELTAQLEASKSELKSIKEEMMQDPYASKIEELTSELKEAKSTIKQLESQVSSDRMELENMQSFIQKAKREHDQARLEKESVRLQIDSVRHEVEKKNEELSSDRNRLFRDNEKLKDRLAKSYEEVHSLKQQLRVEKKVVYDLSEQIEELQTEKRTSNTAKLKQQTESMEDRILLLENENYRMKVLLLQNGITLPETRAPRITSAQSKADSSKRPTSHKSQGDGNGSGKITFQALTIQLPKKQK